MRVIVYVEGRSDIYAMRQLLKPLIERKQTEGIAISFNEKTEGNRKKNLLEIVPIHAVDILLNQPDSIVAILPDLYPKNISFPHETYEQMNDGIRKKFYERLKKKGIQDDSRIFERFHVFCFKHDLEALLLAAEDQLRNHLGTLKFDRSWMKPVEDQDQDCPPKRVVEQLFQDCNRRYKASVDAPMILSGVRYQDIAEKCFQCFKPFVEFIESL